MTDENTNHDNQQIKLAAGIIPMPGKVVAGVAMLQDGVFSLLAIHSTESCDMVDGVPLNFPVFSGAIKEAVEKATQKAGAEMFSVSVGISGGEIMGLNSRGAIYVGKDARMITEEDVKKVVETAGRIELPSDREVLQVIPSGFSVDNKRNLDNPIGLEGYRLECEAHVITVATDAAESLKRAVIKAGWKLENIFYGGWASVIASIGEDDKGRNLLIDVGDSYSDVILVDRRKPVYTSIFNFGMKSLCSVISRDLNVSNKIAEQLIINHGQALFQEDMLLESGVEISVESSEGFPATSVTKGEVCRHIENGLREFLGDIRKKLVAREIIDGLDSVVFAGKVANIHGVVDLGRDVFKAGSRKPESQLSEEFRDSPAINRIVGLLKLTLSERGLAIVYDQKVSAPNHTIAKIKTWFKDFFN